MSKSKKIVKLVAGAKRGAISKYKSFNRVSRSIVVITSSRARRISRTHAYKVVKRVYRHIGRHAKTQTKEVHHRFLITPHINLMD